MRRFAALLQSDVKFQFRHGFYLVYAVITAMYVALLHILPEPALPMAATLIVFSDPSALGYFFIGGIVMLERGQGLYDNLFVTPIKVRHYIASKLLSLGLLSAAAGSAVHLLVFGPHHVTPLFVLGVLLTSCFFTAVGLGIAVRCRSLNGFFLVSPLYTLIFCLPLLDYLGLHASPLYSLLPTSGSLLLIGSPFAPVEGARLLAALLVMAGWTAAAWVWAAGSFQRCIILRIGG